MNVLWLRAAGTGRKMCTRVALDAHAVGRSSSPLVVSALSTHCRRNLNVRAQCILFLWAVSRDG
jgi:hypothetical protein